MIEWLRRKIRYKKALKGMLPYVDQMDMKYGIKVKDLCEYARSCGVSVSELSEEEKLKFVIERKKEI